MICSQHISEEKSCTYIRLTQMTRLSSPFGFPLSIGFLPERSSRSTTPNEYTSNLSVTFPCMKYSGARYLQCKFVRIIVLGRDNSSHDHPMGPLVWIHSRGIYGLGPTNPRVMSIDLHITFDKFHSFQKPYGIKRIAHQPYGISVMWEEYFQHITQFICS